jgi:8-oxo-dGTP pyrophosphatase MutT (NUDIX family)
VCFVVKLEKIRERLAGYEPQILSTAGKKQAAVAIVLDDTRDEPEVLLIERAQREGDPWSGHMALPGGRRDPTDRSPREVAERETHEEVGIQLAQAEYLGRVDDLQGRPESQSGNLIVSAHVYHLSTREALELSDEVAAAFWFPLFSLHELSRQVGYPYPVRAGVELPGILVGEPGRHVVWGLTYRFLEIFFAVVERPLPRRWDGF